MNSYLYTHDHSNTVHNNLKVEAVQMSSSDRMDKQNTAWHIHVIEYYSVLKKEGDSAAWV